MACLARLFRELLLYPRAIVLFTVESNEKINAFALSSQQILVDGTFHFHFSGMNAKGSSKQIFSISKRDSERNRNRPALPSIFDEHFAIKRIPKTVASSSLETMDTLIQSLPLFML